MCSIMLRGMLKGVKGEDRMREGGRERGVEKRTVKQGQQDTT